MSNALDLASDLSKQAGRPAYIEFSTVAKHLPMRSEKEGRYIAMDVDMVTVRQIGAADSCVFETKSWLEQNRREVAGGRLPQEHADYYKKSYQRWKDGQEIPLEGTPIKGWPILSPAQTELLIRLGIRTVEELAVINDEVRTRVGMGAMALKQKAQSWLSQAQDKGPLTMQMAAVQATNDRLEMQLAKLTEHIEALQADRKEPDKQQEQEQADGIGIEDILDEVTPTPRRGRPRKEA